MGFKNTTVQGPNLVNQKAILRVSVFFRQSQMMLGKHLPQVHTMCIHIYIERESVCVYIYIYINIYIYLCLCIKLSIHFALHSIDVSVQLSKGTCTKAAGVAAVWDVAAVHRSFTRKVKSLKRSTGSCWMCLRLSHGLSASMARKSLRWENHRTKWGMASSKPR